jgi:hypothetical protein
MTSVPSSFSVGRDWPSEERSGSDDFGREQTDRFAVGMAERPKSREYPP